MGFVLVEKMHALWRKFTYMNTLKISTLALLCFILFACEKDQVEECPPPANSFSCYVNGVYWEPFVESGISGPVSLEGSYNSESGYFHIKGLERRPDNNVYEYVDWSTFTLLDVGESKMYGGNGTRRGFVDLEGNLPCGPYYHDTLNLGTIIVEELNKSDRRIRGTFEMTLINKSCGADSLMHITNGKFTFNY